MNRTVKRPERPYLGQRELDDVMRVNTELLAELWILRDRVMVLEHLLEQKGVLAPRAVTDFVPQGEFAETLTGERDALVERVIGAPHRDTYDVATLKARPDRD